MTQDLDALFGPSGKSDYSPGDTITFVGGDRELQGKIIHIDAPGESVSGLPTPTTYWVDDDSGFPLCIYQSQIVQRK